MGLWSALKRLFESSPSTDDDASDDALDPFAGATSFPITDELDLHGLPPKMIPEVVESYLEEARRLGFRHVRIIHGKGIGVQRERVQAILARTPYVEAFGDAPHERGGWGATVARLTLAGS
jgi:dsDNA-specific endonuclease/ATPase MutS2